MKRIIAAVVLIALAGCGNQTRNTQASRVAARPAVAVKSTTQVPKSTEGLGDTRAVKGSTDGKLLAIGTLKHGAQITGCILLYDMRTNVLLKKWTVTDGVQSLAFSHNNRLLAVGSADKISLWQLPAGRLIHTRYLNTGGQGSVTCDFAPDGKTLAVGYGELLLLDVARWQPVNIRFRVLPRDSYHPAPAFVSQVAFSPDGRSIATANFDYDNYANLLCDVRTGVCRPIGRRYGGTIALSPDGHLLAGCSTDNSGAQTHIWNTRTRRVVKTLQSGDDSPIPEAFSPDSHVLAASDGLTGHIELWDVRTSKKLRTLPQTNTFAFWADQHTIVTYNQSGIQKIHVNL